MTESNINPFALQVNTAPVVIPEFDVSRNGNVTPKMDDYNPFQQLVGKVPESNPVRDLENLMNTTAPRVAPKVVSTANVQDYLKRGYQLTDLDLNNPNLEQDLSSTQSKGERLMNNMKVTGANFISTAVSMFLTNPADLVDVVRFDENGNVKANSEPITEKSISSSMYNFMTDVADKNRNYETRDDVSKDLWTNITNWMPFVGNSTRGVGKILESTAFGLGAMAGIAGQEALFSLATGGIGTVPMLAAWIQKGLNGSKYLEKALKISRMAEEGAANMSRVVSAGEITNGIAKGLKTVYQSQLGSYSEALFEGLEGKESLHKQLSDDFERIHGYKPQGQELAKIEKTSTDAGILRMNINRALLSVTNFSQYNSIFKSFDAAREGAEAAAEKFGSKVILDDTGKAIVSGNKPLAKWFDSGFGKYVKPLAQVARNMKSGDVVKESLQEGMEEGLQFFTDKSLNNYYTWKHYGENKNVGNALQAATDELFKKEGLESIFTGMFAGGGQTAVANFLTHISKDIKDNITERKNSKLKDGEIPEMTFRQSKKDYETMQAKYADTYNELDERIKNIPEKYRTLPETIKRQLDNIFNNDSIRGTVGDKVQQANASSKLLQIKNAPADEEQFNQALTHEMFNIAVPYVKNGNVDILLKQFEAYKSLDDASFQKMWNTTDDETKNKDKIVDLYLEEFKKIQKSYKRSDNAFQRAGDSKISNAVHNTLKTELAFSLYNSDRLTDTARELENGIGKDYIDMLSNIVATPGRSIVKNKAVKKNKTEIDRINALGDIATREEKLKAQGLEKMNQFLNEMSASTTAKETKKAIYENLVKPYQAEKGIADTYDLEEKLNKIYYLNKVKDRVKVNQDKINAILFSNNPEEYIQEKEAELQIELEKIRQTDNRNKNIETKRRILEAEAKAKAEQAKKPKQPVPVVIQTQEEIDKEFERQSRTKEENLVYDIKQLEDDIENRKQAFIKNGASEEEAEKLANKAFDEIEKGKNRQALNKLKQNLEDLRNQGQEPLLLGNLTEDDLRNGVPILINGRKVKDYTVEDNLTIGKKKSLSSIDVNFESTSTLDYTTAEEIASLKESFFIKDGKLYSMDSKPATISRQLPKAKEKPKQEADKSLIGDFNTIESKDHELAFILDNKDNIQRDMKGPEAKFRATVLTNVVNGHESRESFNGKLELVKWENKQDIEATGFKYENYFLYKKDPVSGVNIIYDGKGSVGVIPLDREVYVDAIEFTIITGIVVQSQTIKNVKGKNGVIEDKQVISYTEFLEELEKNPEAGNKVRAAKFILNRDREGVERNSVSIADLINNHKKYVAFSKYVADNIDNLNNKDVRNSILNQIDVLAFIDDDSTFQNLTPLTKLLGKEIPPIIRVTKNSDGSYTSEIVNKDVFKGEFSKEMFDKKFAIYNTTGNDSWPAGSSKLYTYLFTRNDKYITDTPMQIISAQQRPISAYEEELKTIPKNILEYLQNTTAGVISNISKPEATRANSTFEANKQGDSLQINIEYSEGKNDLPALKDKVFVDFSLLQGKTVAEVGVIIQEAVTKFNNKEENKGKEFKFELFKSLKTIKGSYTDYSAILANNYSTRNDFQVYSTLMLKIIPDEKQGGAPVNPITTNITVKKLNELKELILNTENILPLVQNILKSFDEKEFDDWQTTVDTQEIIDAVLSKSNSTTTEAETNNLTYKYIFLKYINEKLGIVYTDSSSTVPTAVKSINAKREKDLEEESYRIIESSELYKDNEGNFYKVNKLKNGKTQVLIADENGRTIGEIGTYDKGVSLDMILNGSKTEYGTRTNTNSRLELSKVKDLEVRNKIVDKINEKYDKEIKDLETANSKLNTSNNNQNPISGMESFGENDDFNDQQTNDSSDALEAMLATLRQNSSQAPSSNLPSFSDEDSINQQDENSNNIMAAFLANRKSSSVVPIIPIILPVLAPIVPAQALTPKQAQVQKIQNDLKLINFELNKVTLERIESDGTKTLDRVVAHLYKEGVFILKTPIAMSDGVLRYLGVLGIKTEVIIQSNIPSIKTLEEEQQKEIEKENDLNYNLYNILKKEDKTFASVGEFAYHVHRNGSANPYIQKLGKVIKQNQYSFTYVSLEGKENTVKYSSTMKGDNKYNYFSSDRITRKFEKEINAKYDKLKAEIPRTRVENNNKEEAKALINNCK